MDRDFAHRKPGSGSSSDSGIRLEAHVSVIAADELAAGITSPGFAGLRAEGQAELLGAREPWGIACGPPRANSPALRAAAGIARADGVPAGCA